MFLPRKKKPKYYPEKKSAQIFEKFAQKIQICPVTESSHLLMIVLESLYMRWL